MSFIFSISLVISGIGLCSKLINASLYIEYISTSLSSVCKNDVSHSIVALYSLSLGKSFIRIALLNVVDSSLRIILADITKFLHCDAR